MEITSRKFVDKFRREDKDEVIPWSEDGKYIGFSVLRGYKKGLGFIPAITKSGEEDTKALIKIGIRIPEEDIKEIPLFLSVSKYSKYRSSHFGLNFSDGDAPTPESLIKSANSKQPIDLEDRDKFIMKDNPISFFEKKTKKQIELKELIDSMYNSHIQTISSVRGKILKTKLSFRDSVCSRVIPIFISILKNLLGLLGKEIKNDKDDFAVGLFKPYSFQKHIETKYPYSLPFFSSNARMSLYNIFWVSLLLILFWFLYFSKQNIDGIFAISLSIILVTVFEFLIPLVLIKKINALIIFRGWFERKKFTFK